MKTMILLILCMTLAAFGVRAQDMNVIHTDAQVTSLDLADIESVTFSQNALRGSGDILRVHAQSGLSQFAVNNIDSICFLAVTTMAIYQPVIGSTEFDLAYVDSLTFGASSESPITVTYSGTSATVVNPLEDLGVTVDVSGADVTVTAAAGLSGIEYLLSGTTSDGMFKIYSDGDFTLQLNGVQITNQDGPAINVQADETISVTLVDGTTTTLTDGATYADAPNDEDQKAAFFSEGQLIFSGTGNLVINGQGDDQHGLVSDDYIEVQNGSIVINSAVKDGLHTNEGFYQQGGTIEIWSDSDGIDAGDGPIVVAGGELTIHHDADDKKAMKCDGQIQIVGGEIDITVAGDQSKGIDGPEILLVGGTIDIYTSGAAVLESSGSGYDPSYCTAIKGDDLVQLDGADVTITTIGQAGRGISCDGDIVVISGNLEVTSSGGGASYTNELGEADAYTGPCLKADGDVILSGGDVTLSHSGSGGKGISGDADFSVGLTGGSPNLQITTTGSEISYGWGEAAEAKAVSVDSTVTIAGGTLTLDAADDAIKSKYWIEINGGTIDIVDCLEGIESPMLVINDGEIRVHSTDDGLNTTYGVDGENDDGSELIINGGYVALVAPAGDALDSNGTFEINGGTLIVHGPPNDPEVGIDVNGTFTINGGFIVVAQLNGMMVETPSSAPDQRSVMLRRNQTLTGGTLFRIETTSGTGLVTFQPEYRYSNILFSSPELASGTTYRVYTGGSCTGSEQDGLYTGGTYSGGTLRATFTSSGTVQTVNF